MLYINIEPETSSAISISALANTQNDTITAYDYMYAIDNTEKTPNGAYNFNQYQYDDEDKIVIDAIDVFPVYLSNYLNDSCSMSVFKVSTIAILMDFCAKQFKQEYGVDCTKDSYSLYKLYNKCKEICKKLAATKTVTTKRCIRIKCLYKEYHFKSSMTQSDLIWLGQEYEQKYNLKTTIPSAALSHYDFNYNSGNIEQTSYACYEFKQHQFDDEHTILVDRIDFLNDKYLADYANDSYLNSSGIWKVPQSQILMHFLIEQMKKQSGMDCRTIDDVTEKLRNKCKLICKQLAATAEDNKMTVTIPLLCNEINFMSSVTTSLLNSLCKAFEEQYNLKTVQ